MKLFRNYQHNIACAAALAACASLAACSWGPPQPEKVDGAERHDFNTPTAADAYTSFAQKSKDAVAVKQRMRFLAAVERATKPANDVERRSLAARQVASQVIEANGRNAVYRFTFAFNNATLDVPALVSRSLVNAATKATRIEVRGRTDAIRDTHADKRIALARAVAAKDFLVENGIDASKIVVSSLASGGFRTENISDGGRAQNRRVEIELVGVDATAVKSELIASNR